MTSLELFSHFKNPRSLYQEPQLRQLYQDVSTKTLDGEHVSGEIKTKNEALASRTTATSSDGLRNRLEGSWVGGVEF